MAACKSGSAARSDVRVDEPALTDAFEEDDEDAEGVEMPQGESQMK